jgi:hypothetical protein
MPRLLPISSRLVLRDLAPAQDAHRDPLGLRLDDLRQDVRVDVHEVPDEELLDDVRGIEVEVAGVARDPLPVDADDGVLADLDPAGHEIPGPDLRALGVQGQRHRGQVLDEADDPGRVAHLGVGEIEAEQADPQLGQANDDALVQR